MARVSHKKIKQLIAQKQSKITDRQFFTSRILAAHFADIAAAQTRRYGCRRRVKLDRKSTRLNSSHTAESRMPSSA